MKPSAPALRPHLSHTFYLGVTRFVKETAASQKSAQTTLCGPIRFFGENLLGLAQHSPSDQPLAADDAGELLRFCGDLVSGRGVPLVHAVVEVDVGDYLQQVSCRGSVAAKDVQLFPDGRCDRTLERLFHLGHLGTEVFIFILERRVERAQLPQNIGLCCGQGETVLLLGAPVFDLRAEDLHHLAYPPVVSLGDHRYGTDKSKAGVAGRFAPKANPHFNIPSGREVNILVATDVMAEGLNLQDGDVIVNYDLHWNPVRLIQRFGRIDRIGSKNDSIWGFNFLPETSLDRNLGLQAVLSQRIQEIHDTIGEDAAILDKSEQINEEAMFAIYQKKGDQMDFDEDDFVDINEAEEMLRSLRKDDPDEFQRIAYLRDGIRSARAVFSNRGNYVFCQAGRYQQLFLTDEDGAVASRDVPAVLGRIQCSKDEPAIRGVAGRENQTPRPSCARTQVSVLRIHCREVRAGVIDRAPGPRAALASAPAACSGRTRVDDTHNSLQGIVGPQLCTILEDLAVEGATRVAVEVKVVDGCRGERRVRILAHVSDGRHPVVSRPGAPIHQRRSHDSVRFEGSGRLD
jgi:Helicase conserved C-terminal domain